LLLGRRSSRAAEFFVQVVGVVLQFRQAGAIALELALWAVVVGFLSKFCKFGVCVSNFLGRLIARDLDLHLDAHAFNSFMSGPPGHHSGGSASTS
jgi:hypothetical protein